LRCVFKVRSAVSSAIAVVSLLLALGETSSGQARSAAYRAPRQTAENSRATGGGQSEQSAELGGAKSLIEKGEFDQAEGVVRIFLGEHGNSAEAHFVLGYILFREIQTKASLEGHTNSKFEEQKANASLAEYTEGAKYHPPSAADLKTVALDYVLLHDYVDADKWLTRSLQWNPKDSDGWYYLGRTKYNENRFEEAISAFEKCLKLEPRNVKAEDNIGLSYAGLGRVQDATAAYHSAITWQERDLNQDSGPFTDLGALLLDQNRPQEAVSYLLHAVAISPQESRAHEQLGKAYEHLDQLTKAQSEFEKAVELAPEDARLHYVLGKVYRKEGLSEKAKFEFDRSTALRRDSPSEGRNP
jgi:tetratricopeptide (TPR) repeat protein